MIIKDQLNRKIHIEKVPKRIISLVPSQTELLVDLGLENLIVGVTKFCVHPKHLKSAKAIVGGTKRVKFEKIRNLKPDIILCNKEENTLEMIEELEKIAPVHISDIYTLEDCYDLILAYGKIFNCAFKASSIIENIESERLNYKNIIQDNSNIKVAYFIWKEPWMVVGSNTFINVMLKEAGFINVFADKERYPEVILDDKSLQKAEIILLSSEPYPFKQMHVNELIQKYPAKKIIVVDGELFSWYGSRLAKSYDYFKLLLNNLNLLSS